ncbi:MAG: hypothetical protein AAFQ80_04240 [Cyanobacteria bacterium J06621_8]
MAKLQDIYLLIILLWFTGNTTSTLNAQAVTHQNQNKLPTSSLENNTSTLNKSDSFYELAQKPTPKPSDNPSDEEMLDALQQRQDKIEQNLNKLKKLTGQESESSSQESKDLTEEEMIDAINQRQNKIQELKELKQLEEKLNEEATLKALQEENFNVDSLEDLEQIRTVINNKNLSQEEIFNTLQEQNFQVDTVDKLKQLRKLLKKPKDSAFAKESGMSQPMAFKMLTIGLPATLLVFLIATPFAKGFLASFKSNYQEKFGKPKVPEGSVNLHSRSFKEITLIGNKAEQINNDKFGNEEFLLLLRIKINMSKEAEGYQGLSNCVDLLQAGIIAQKSFLRLEQTELRYRSRKQQEFYQYLADSLGDGDNIDREAFAKKVKKKQAEVLPLITTEEGRGAIDTYAKEINVLSKYRLGLKLLALFKQYELQDFSILKNVSDVVETLESKDLLSSDDLVSPVLEHYESFEKLGPIIGISAAESTPQAYARILQVIGLTNRHGKAYVEFAQLVSLLKKWEKPYKAISLVRKEYTEDKYSLPAEFKEDIPGVKVYQRYAEYLHEL